MISQTEQVALSQSVTEIEKQTDAEIVLVVAAASDNYNYIPTLWAALIALLAPFLLLISPFHLSEFELVLSQLLVFTALALLFRLRPILSRLIPRHIRHWRASTMARRQFLDNNLHYTRGQTGVLIFVSLLEHHAEILADRGIDQMVGKAQWQTIVDALVESLREGNLTTGLQTSVASCGELLIRHVPATEEKNELPNHVVIL